MAWTNPKTFITGEVITANDLNVYVKDNTNYLYTNSALSPVNLFPGQHKQTFEPLGNNSTSATQIGVPVVSSGTATGRTVANTNIFTSKNRIGYVSGAGAVLATGVRSNTVNLLPRDANLTRMRFSFGISLSPAAAKRGFFGFTAAATANQPNTAFTDAAAYPNLFGVGFDNADTTLKLYHNDGAGGAPTAIDLGFSIATASVNVSWYSVELKVDSSSNFSYWVQQSNTGSTVSGTATTNVPANTTFLGWRTQIINTALVSYGVDLGIITVEQQDLTGTWPA
jgi:hypothetical protein